jgi:Lrp/AsnC family leucine-responsive transcriptional regulator
VDAIDQQLLILLLHDGRATYQELGRQVRLSANTVADRVRRLQTSGVIRGYGAELSMEALGRTMEMISDIRLRDHGVERTAFEAQLGDVPQVIGAVRLTGEYDYQLRIACAGSPEFESVVDRLKRELGVSEVRSRLILHEVPLSLDRVIG